MKEKMKNWYEENKETIKAEAVRVGWYALGLGVGYFVGDKVSTYKINDGLNHVHEAGIIKFFDPTTGLEVTTREAINVMNRELSKK